MAFLIFKNMSQAFHSDLKLMENKAIAIESGDGTLLNEISDMYLSIQALSNAIRYAENEILLPAMKKKNLVYACPLEVNKQLDAQMAEMSSALAGLTHLKEQLHSVENDKWGVLSSQFMKACNTAGRKIEWKNEHIWPIFEGNISAEEQSWEIGLVIGTMATSVIKWILDRSKGDPQVMDTWKEVTKNTNFGCWLEDCSSSGAASVSDYVAEDAGPPTFYDESNAIFGCAHTVRNCKIFATCCNKWFTCHKCHDEAMENDHTMGKNVASVMMCMHCLKTQPIRDVCGTPSCNGLAMGKYSCTICKVFDDHDIRPLYHCVFCNLCRSGKELGPPLYHCMTCNYCMRLEYLEHKCVSKCLETECPICREYLYPCHEPIFKMVCGHVLHASCFSVHANTQYKCPLCRKTILDMGVVANDPLAYLYATQNQDIFCHDCEKDGPTLYHPDYHKCSFCGSYNTRLA